MSFLFELDLIAQYLFYRFRFYAYVLVSDAICAMLVQSAKECTYLGVLLSESCSWKRDFLT